jgi:hypothetical protein
MVFTLDPIALAVLLIGLLLAILGAIGFAVAICRGMRAERRRGLQ